MKFKQINKGYKCPNCKMFGLQPFHKHMGYIEPQEHIGHDGCPTSFNYYRCRNCYAEFTGEETITPKQALQRLNKEKEK